MASSGLNAKHVKTSSLTGRTAPKKQDGYARGPVPESMLANKPGKSYDHGYSGPTAAQGKF